MAGMLASVCTISVGQEVPLQPGDSLINSKRNEIKPMLSPDGTKFYYTRSNEPDNIGGRKDKGDIFMLDLTNPSARPVRLNGVNSPITDKVAGFDISGSKMYVVRNDEEARYKKSANLFLVPLAGGKGTETEIDYFYNKARHQDITVSPDGKTMILSIESYSTYGLEDLYVSFLQANGKWSEPKNLGNQVNSPLQELGGFLAEDGRTLYFASNRLGGWGSVDIYESIRLDDTWKNWSQPKNLGTAINTSGTENFFYTPSKGNWSYYISTQNSEGFGDIKRIMKPEPPVVEPLPEETVTLEPIVSSEPEANSTGNEEPVMTAQIANEPEAEEEPQGVRFSGTIMAEDNQSLFAKLVVSSRNTNYVDSSSAANSFNMLLPTAGDYKVSVSAKGYFSKDTLIQLNGATENFRLELSPIKVGATVRLENVMFQQSTAVLLEGSYPALNEVVKLLQENRGLEILLTGHTDNQGSSRANIKLSKERVDAVRDYLVSRGVDVDRIEGKGYGGTRPIASNANETTRKLNRRVEFTVVKNN